MKALSLVSRVLAVGAVTAASAALLPGAAQADPQPANCKTDLVWSTLSVPGAEAWCVGGSSGKFRIAIHCFRVALPSYWAYGTWYNVTSNDVSYKTCNAVGDSLKSYHIEYK